MIACFPCDSRRVVSRVMVAFFLCCLFVRPAGAASVYATADFSTPSVSFAAQLPGTTSASQTVTLTNHGNGTLFLSSGRDSNNVAFDQTNNCGGSVNPGSSCTITVTFNPAASGSYNGLITITDNAAGGT